jgi:hypothetical protein
MRQLSAIIVHTLVEMLPRVLRQAVYGGVATFRHIIARRGKATSHHVGLKSDCQGPSLGLE